MVLFIYTYFVGQDDPNVLVPENYSSISCSGHVLFVKLLFPYILCTVRYITSISWDQMKHSATSKIFFPRMNTVSCFFFHMT